MIKRRRRGTHQNCQHHPSAAEDFITEFGRVPIILLNPDSDCFYQKTGANEKPLG
jgi:hypothetical protein